MQLGLSPVPAAKCPPLCFLCRRLSDTPPAPESGSGNDVALPLCVCRKDDKDYALKQIEGTGISMSACREIAVGTAQLTFVWSLLNTVMLFQVGLCNVTITFTK